MALENKLGLTSSADLAREEEQSARKRLLTFLKRVFYIISPPASFLHCRQSINISLRTFTILRVSSEPSILQKAISVLRL